MRCAEREIVTHIPFLSSQDADNLLVIPLIAIRFFEVLDDAI
jgi:hypothetical protein